MWPCLQPDIVPPAIEDLCNMFALLSLLSHSVMVSVGFLSVVVSPYITRATRASNFRLLSSTALIIFGCVHKYGAESWPCRQ